MTQEETAQALEPLLGQRLPQASISAIERAYDGDRRREFDAQEILAFALAFDLPLIWFFLPPSRRPSHHPAHHQYRQRAIRDRLRARRPARAGLRPTPPARHRRSRPGRAHSRGHQRPARSDPEGQLSRATEGAATGPPRRLHRRSRSGRRRDRRLLRPPPPSRSPRPGGRTPRRPRLHVPPRTSQWGQEPEPKERSLSGAESVRQAADDPARASASAKDFGVTGSRSRTTIGSSSLTSKSHATTLAR
jgi:hypothetical protein